MRPGDKFIRYSKGGHVTRGEVVKTWTKYSIDLKNGVVIKKRMIVSDGGHAFDSNECYVIDREISFGFLKKIRSLFLRKARNTSPNQAQ